MRTFPEIWRELPLEERRKAAAAFWAAVKKGDSGWQFGIDYLADRLRSRSVFIEKTLNLEKRIHHLAVQPNPPDILIRTCLQQLLLVRRPHILRRFVDVTGIPHVEGRIDAAVAYKREPPDREILEKAVERVYSEFDGVEVRLYLDCLFAECPPFWVALPDARAAVEARRDTGGAVEAVPAPPSGVTAPAAEVPSPARSRDPLTNLDHAVMDAVVASVAGGVGALPEDQIRDLVEEFVTLNPKRLASYFHRGFLEVLAGREPTFDWPEANAERRAWYLCGALAALSRRSDRTAVVRLAEARPEETRALGSRREEAPVAATPVTGNVVFFGGNESQERYRDEVLRWATERWPGVTLTLEPTGWSSNWGRELTRYENLIGRADAVVIMRFVRTLLGMHLRRMCGQAGIPWVACTGHGRDSMKNSIAAAVARCAG